MDAIANNGEGGFDGARAVAAAMSAKALAYLYQFAYVPEWRKKEQPRGAPHSAEIVYVFDSWDYTSLRVGGTVQPIDRDVAQTRQLVLGCVREGAGERKDARLRRGLQVAGVY
jgi:carboxylesterase type B